MILPIFDRFRSDEKFLVPCPHKDYQAVNDLGRNRRRTNFNRFS